MGKLADAILAGGGKIKAIMSIRIQLFFAVCLFGRWSTGRRSSLATVEKSGQLVPGEG
jgi:hypothetical protein